jgi:hypothetical protein
MQVGLGGESNCWPVAVGLFAQTWQTTFASGRCAARGGDVPRPCTCTMLWTAGSPTAVDHTPVNPRRVSEAPRFMSVSRGAHPPSGAPLLVRVEVE